MVLVWRWEQGCRAAHPQMVRKWHLSDILHYPFWSNLHTIDICSSATPISTNQARILGLRISLPVLTIRIHGQRLPATFHHKSGQPKSTKKYQDAYGTRYPFPEHLQCLRTYASPSSIALLLTFAFVFRLRQFGLPFFLSPFCLQKKGTGFCDQF